MAGDNMVIANTTATIDKTFLFIAIISLLITLVYPESCPGLRFGLGRARTTSSLAVVRESSCEVKASAAKSHVTDD